jgi:transcriptional regulator with XRE-family HTH domain
MQQIEQPAAPVVRLRMDRFDERARQLGLPNDSACAKYIGVNRGTLSRIRSGETTPGERFIAACLSSKFAKSFEWMFELGEAS